MRAEKKVIGKLNKCYAVAEFSYDGERHLICSAEKEDPCYVFTLDGQQVDRLWDGPGGVMTLLQDKKSREPLLLATQLFYSPNNSADAKIVYYTRENGEWKCHLLCRLPFVHRFGIVERSGNRYLVACTLKSAHAFKDDWTCPGRVWTALLPDDLTVFNEENQLQLTPFVSGLYKNHGFCVGTEQDYTFALVGTENGVLKVVPPEKPENEWSTEYLLQSPASDMLYLDFDGDGERELLVLSPFHGDSLAVWKKTDGEMKQIYQYPEKLPFLHAIWGQEIRGKYYAFVGNRQEDRRLMAVYFDAEKGDYRADILDKGAGPANCIYFEEDGIPKLLASNRETDEIAVYTLDPEG